MRQPKSEQFKSKKKENVDKLKREALKVSQLWLSLTQAV